MVWVLSVLVAALAYFCGCLDAGVIAGNFVFHRNLSRLGKGNVGFSNFRRIYGWKGFAVLFGIEAVIDLLPILIGSIFFSTLKVKNVDTALIGRALAGYCLTVGRLWPYTRDFHGRSGAFALLFTAFGISMPSIVKALQKTRGKLFPFGWWPLLKSMFIKHGDMAELLLVGVHPDYQNSGVNSLVFMDMFRKFNAMGIKVAETNAILETNLKNQGQFRDFEHECKKRRRSYIKKLEY